MGKRSNFTTMREIKFRAWDDGKMIYQSDIHHLSLEDYEVLRLAKFFCNVRDDCKLMQYTGLKDKNGKEIYEGDILKDGAVVKWFDALTWDSGGSLHSGFYCSEWLEGDSDLCYHDSFNDVEVIGNIYQNPELVCQP
jgi:hypothetical protein